MFLPYNILMPKRTKLNILYSNKTLIHVLSNIYIKGLKNNMYCGKVLEVLNTQVFYCAGVYQHLQNINWKPQSLSGLSPNQLLLKHCIIDTILYILLILSGNEHFLSATFIYISID